jgi:hypothetical protein
LLPRKPDRVIATASPILGPPEARDMAITDLFDENALTFVRLAANRPLAIEPLSEDLATSTW